MLTRLANNNNKTVSNSWSINQESLYTTINNLIISQINAKGQIYFSFIYSLFIFILINNLLGMVPYSFASICHFIFAFSFSFIIVLSATILGFQTHGLKFFSLFVPARCSLALFPLVANMRFYLTISHFILAFSLSKIIVSFTGLLKNTLISEIYPFYFLGLIEYYKKMVSFNISRVAVNRSLLV